MITRSGIVQGDLAHEVALAAELFHAVDGGAGQDADAVLELAQVLRHEPALGEGAVFHVVRLVHLHERVEQRAPGGAGGAALLDRLVRGEGGGVAPVGEQRRCRG